MKYLKVEGLSLIYFLAMPVRVSPCYIIIQYVTFLSLNSVFAYRLQPIIAEKPHLWEKPHKTPQETYVSTIYLQMTIISMKSTIERI